MWSGELQLTAVGGVFWVVGVGFGVTWGCCAVWGVAQCVRKCLHVHYSVIECPREYVDV
jgi:hypothetical protein